MQSFDKITYMAANAKLSYEDRRTLLTAQTLGSWSATKAKEHYKEGDGKCPYCGKDDSGTIHEVWSCSALRPL